MSSEVSVVEIVAQRLQIDQEILNDETQFESDLDAESLDLVEIAEAIEQHTGVHIPDDDLATIHTVGDLKTYVAERE